MKNTKMTYPCGGDLPCPETISTRQVQEPNPMVVLVLVLWFISLLPAVCVGVTVLLPWGWQQNSFIGIIFCLSVIILTPGLMGLN